MPRRNPSRASSSPSGSLTRVRLALVPPFHIRLVLRLPPLVVISPFSRAMIRPFSSTPSLSVVEGARRGRYEVDSREKERPSSSSSSVPLSPPLGAQVPLRMVPLFPRVLHTVN